MATANNGGTAERREPAQRSEQQRSEQQQASGGQLQRQQRQPLGATLARPESWVTRSPFGMMRRMFDDMERLFEGLPTLGLGLGGTIEDELDTGIRRSLPRGLWAPQIDVREKDGKLLVRADLPGLKSDEVQVNVEDDILTIAGERRDESEGEHEGVYRRERSYGRFERSIALPQGIDPNAIDAKFEDGVLQITAPIPQRATRGRRIDVKGASSKPLGSGGEGEKEKEKQRH